jgi:vacuolar protein sorting-associated protein 53
LLLGELAENVAEMINPQFANKVDMSKVHVTDLIFVPNLCEYFIDITIGEEDSTSIRQYLQDEFLAMITKSLMTLVHGLETKFDAEMVAMAHVPWATLESVGDQSD